MPEPQVASIAKGQAGLKYEFGQKVSIATTSNVGWPLGTLCLPGNSYDGHTLKAQMSSWNVFISKKSTSKRSTWTWESDYRLKRNRLKGRLGDALNAIFSAVDMNFK